jgi:hypothetical protein
MHSALHLLSTPYKSIFRLPSLTFEEKLDLATHYAKLQVHKNVTDQAIAAEQYFKGRDDIREFLFMVKEYGIAMVNTEGELRYHIINR